MTTDKLAMNLKNVELSRKFATMEMNAVETEKSIQTLYAKTVRQLCQVGQISVVQNCGHCMCSCCFDNHSAFEHPKCPFCNETIVTLIQEVTFA
jgi:hypothetical protein